MERILLWIAITLVALILLVLIGLRIQPRSFPAYPGAPGPIDYTPLPEGLPAPVVRFYRAVYGEEVETRGVPLITSAVITGRASLRLGPVTMPGRFRFTHVAGQDYRHYIETTFFGIPIFRVNETYIDGRGRQEIPFGVVDNDPRANQAAALGLWAETGWFPAVFVTDERVRWEPLDDHAALLTVPYNGDEEVFIARFDPQTGLLLFFEAMRYRETDSERKVLWITEAKAWGEVNGHRTMVIATVVWLDQGTPWAVFHTEEMVLNADVSDYVRDRGL
jgi:hypothetical protein